MNPGFGMGRRRGMGVGGGAGYESLEREQIQKKGGIEREGKPLP